jgi:hypothetical protein
MANCIPMNTGLAVFGASAVLAYGRDISVLVFSTGLKHKSLGQARRW